MKSQKGISLVSLLIYLTAMTITVTIIARISTYFFGNVKEVNDDTMASAEIIRFNTYFTKDINTEGNFISDIGTEEVNGNTKKYVVFGGTNNKYSFINNEIYMNNILICSGIQDCSFDMSSNDKVTVVITIDNNAYTNIYRIF